MRTGLKLIAFLAVSLFILTSLVLELGQIDFEDRYELTATFDDVQGLLEGDPVKLAGVAVGRVTSIRPVAGRAEVRFAVDEDVVLPTDTEAVIRWRNLLGQRYLYVEPGEAEGSLADGDEVASTRSVVDIGRLFNELGPLARVLDPDQLNELVEALGQALGGNDAAIDSLLDDLGTLLQAVASRDEAIGTLLVDADTLAAGLSTRDEQIRTMVENLVSLVQAFEANRDTVGQALVEAATLTDGVDALLTGNATSLDTILRQLAVVTGTVAGRLDVLEETLATLPAAGNDLFDAFVARGTVIFSNVTCLEVGGPPCEHPTTGVVEDPPPAGAAAGGPATAGAASAPATPPPPTDLEGLLILLGSMGAPR